MKTYGGHRRKFEIQNHIRGNQIERLNKKKKKNK